MGVDPASLALIIGSVASLATAGAGVATSMQKPPASPRPKSMGDEAKTNQVRQAELERKRAAAAANGQGSTVLTSPLGDTTQQAGSLSLLGS